MASDPNDVTQELDRRKRFEDVKQYEFKRRCAFYSFFLLSCEVLYLSWRSDDVPQHTGLIFSDVVWALSFVIITAMSAEAVTAFASMRQPRG